MNQAAVPVGTNPLYTTDSIVESELKKLRNMREKMANDNEKYIEQHPELHTLLDEFVTACISSKPNDIVKFGAFFFRDKKTSGGMGPCPIVICGPSGVGKGTIVTKIMERFPSIFGFFISHTTRAPRPGEDNGVHYNFVSKSDMEEAIDKGEFIEYAKVHTNLYGTSFAAVETVRKSGKICILDIDTQGVKNVKLSHMDAKYIFIMPPSLDELTKRLKGRGTESSDKIRVRLENAPAEIEYGKGEGNFDAIVTNRDVDEAAAEILKILQGWYPAFDLEYRPEA